MRAPANQQTTSGFPTLNLNPERCLNTYHHEVGCTLCADSCPVQGTIFVLDGTPILDEGACRQCGLCLHLCPTGCFTQEGPRIDGLSRTLSTLPDDPVDLLCPHHPGPEHGHLPLAVQTGRCLAALSPAALLELTAAGRKVTLDDTPCGECRLVSVHPFLERTVAEVSAWESLLGGPARIALRSTVAELQRREERRVVDARQQLLSRRDLFGSVREVWSSGTSGDPGEAPADPERSESASPPATASRQALPPHRARLLAILRTWGASRSEAGLPVTCPGVAAEPSLPVIEVVIDSDRCSACGVCARACPTSAFGFGTDQDGFRLTFDASRCLGPSCQLCRHACPEGAVSTGPAAVSPAWLSAAPRTLASGSLIPCGSCGAPVAFRPERPPTCLVCRSLPQKPDFTKSLKWVKMEYRGGDGG